MRTLIFSQHSLTRMQQRGITRRMVEIAVRYGEPDHVHARLRYTLTDRRLRDSPFGEESDRLRGIRVIVASDNTVVTVARDSRLGRPGVLRKSTLCARKPDRRARRRDLFGEDPQTPFIGM